MQMRQFKDADAFAPNRRRQIARYVLATAARIIDNAKLLDSD